MRSALIHLLLLFVLFFAGIHFWALPIILLWFLISSTYAFLIYGWDKILALKHGVRISEADLYLLAAVGGFAGAFFGMKIFRHKTNKREFHYRFMLACVAGFSVYTIWMFKE